MKRFAFSIFLAVLLAGCAHGQVPPTTWQASITWQLPVATANLTGCTAAQTCVFAVSRAAIATGAACPPTNGSGYTLVTTTAAQATSALDSSVASGQSYCYIVQTQQVIPPATQASTSAPSNSASVGIPLNPGVPTAPSVTPTPGTTQSGQMVKPGIGEPAQWAPAPKMNSTIFSAPMNVSVRLVAKR